MTLRATLLFAFGCVDASRANNCKQAVIEEPPDTLREPIKLPQGEKSFLLNMSALRVIEGLVTLK
jgi:hypothetical protein